MDNWIWMMMIFRTSKTGPYRLFKLLWRANIPFASRHQHLIHFNRIPGSKHSSKTDNSIEVDQLRIRAQFLSLYTNGILGGCPESNSEVSECKAVSWEVPVVPSFLHPGLWLKGKRSSDRGDLQGWHGSSLYQVETKILARYLGSPVETLHSPSIHQEHPSEEPSSARTDKSWGAKVSGWEWANKQICIHA